MQRSLILSLSLLLIAAFPSIAIGNPAPVVRSSPPHRPVLPGTALAPSALRRLVARQIVGNPEIAALIPRQPVLGGTWSVASDRDVRFVAPGVVAIDYEDGHIAGRLVVRVVDAADRRTWVVLEDRER